jgi:hypothetical protein
LIHFVGEMYQKIIRSMIFAMSTSAQSWARSGPKGSVC